MHVERSHDSSVFLVLTVAIRAFPSVLQGNAVFSGLDQTRECVARRGRSNRPRWRPKRELRGAALFFPDEACTLHTLSGARVSQACFIQRESFPPLALSKHPPCAEDR